MLAKRTPAPGLEWAGILVLVTAALLVLGVPSAGAAEGWLVKEQPGTLQYRLPESSDWSPASPGVELQPGTSVRAGSGRPAVLSQDQSRIVIRAGSELILPPMASETVVQRLGSVRYQVEPRSVADFLVETPYLVIGIKGTIFEVMVTEAGAEVQVSEGLVEVATPDGRFRAILARGQSARVGSAAGSVLEVQSESGGSDAPVPPDSTGSAPSEEASRSDAALPSTQTVIGGVIIPLTSTAKSLWSGIGELLSDVDVVYDDRLPTRRPGTVVRTLRGGLATVGSGAGGDSDGGHSDGSSSSGGGDAGGSGGGGLGGGGLGGAVGSVGGAVGGAVGSVGSAVGGLGSAVGGALGSR